MGLGFFFLSTKLDALFIFSLWSYHTLHVSGLSAAHRQVVENVW
jgi:hypothetical protein